MRHKLLTLGADPEYALHDVVRFRSAAGTVEGSKDDPFPVPHGSYQQDGVAGEIGIDPAKTEFQFTRRLRLVTDSLTTSLKPYAIGLKIVASAEFDEDQLSDPSVQEVGCNPDYNAYSGEQNPIPSYDAIPNLRVFGGHVHFGWNNPEDTDDAFIHNVIKYADLYMGIASVLMDDDTRRRTLYGQAGAFRPKPYGAEYRTLSNFWLSSIHKMKWVFKMSRKVVSAANKPFPSLLEEPVVRCINTSDKELAKSLVQMYSLELPDDYKL